MSLDLDIPAGSFDGVISFGSAITPPTITANQTNYNPAGFQTCNIMFLSSSGNRTITGFAQPSPLVATEFRMIAIVNIGGSNITLINNSASSLPQNRFNMNGNILLNQNEGCILTYDSVNLRWRAIAKAI